MEPDHYKLASLPTHGFAIRSIRQPPPPIRMVSECGPSHIRLRSLWGINWALVLKKNIFRFHFFLVGCALAMGKKWLLGKAGVREEDRPRFRRLVSHLFSLQPKSFPVEKRRYPSLPGLTPGGAYFGPTDKKWPRTE